ncbi:YjcZ family sporulation protein [Ectobacillus panaciterrae]
MKISSSFTLIVVLFILLIIVATVAMDTTKNYKKAPIYTGAFHFNKV